MSFISFTTGFVRTLRKSLIPVVVVVVVVVVKKWVTSDNWLCSDTASIANSCCRCRCQLLLFLSEKEKLFSFAIDGRDNCFLFSPQNDFYPKWERFMISVLKLNSPPPASTSPNMVIFCFPILLSIFLFFTLFHPHHLILILIIILITDINSVIVEWVLCSQCASHRNIVRNRI